MTRLINSILMITANTITIITTIVGTTITTIYLLLRLHPKKSPMSKTPQPTKHKFLSPIAATKLNKQESLSVDVHAYT